MIEPARLRPVVLAEDIEALVALILRCDLRVSDWATPAGLPSAEEESIGWRELSIRPGARMVAAVDADDTILGTCAYVGATDDDETLILGTAHIIALFVDPPAWRRGIGRQLLAWAESAMSRDGYATGRLTTLEHSPAEQLYAAHGWQRTGARGTYPTMELPTVRYAKALA